MNLDEKICDRLITNRNNDLGKSLAPALSRGLKVLELITREGSLYYNQLERTIGFNASSLNRILKVLIEEGYINKSDDGRYSPGLKVFALTQLKTLRGFFTNKVNPILNEISNEFQVTAAFYIFGEYVTIIIDKVMHPDNISMRPIGEEKNDYLLSPWGFVYMAQFSSDEQKKFIKRNIESYKEQLKLPTEEELNRFIALARERGYGDDEGAILDDIRRLAAPIYGIDGNIMAAIGIGSFTSRLDKGIIDKLTHILKEKAELLSLPDYLWKNKSI